ncbi:MAG: hypothetical protein ABSD74_20465 [Rhizomicrobium sp.]|jgi:hypothetical protein
MNPEVDQILLLSASQLMGTIAPLLPEGYPQGQASLLSFMMVLGAQEFGRAADIRAKENAGMRALFGESAPGVNDAGLRRRLEAAVSTRDDDLTIAGLNAANAELRRLLIELQIHAEAHGNRDAETSIWEVLKRSAEARLVKLA